jgi:hypothetical protein
MRRFLGLVVVAAAGSIFVGGCALTDYTFPVPDYNTTHALTDCVTADRVTQGPNAQQTSEKDAQAQAYNLEHQLFVGPPPGNGNCVTGFTPQFGALLSHQDARDMGRFNGPWLWMGGAKVDAGPGGDCDPANLEFGIGGHWELGGIKDLGGTQNLRISNHYRANGDTTFPWACGGNQEARSGSPEGSVVQDRFGRLPGIFVESYAIDYGSDDTEYCPNLYSMNPDRLQCGGLSTYWAVTARGYEGRIDAVPVKHTAGLAEFFAGEAIELSHNGFTGTVSGELREDGMIVARWESLTYNGNTVTFSRPLEVVGSRNLKNFEFDLVNQEDLLVELSVWALENGIGMDQPVVMGGFLPEFGIQVPAHSYLLSRENIGNWVSTVTSQIDPRERDRLR